MYGNYKNLSIVLQMFTVLFYCYIFDIQFFNVCGPVQIVVMSGHSYLDVLNESFIIEGNIVFLLDIRYCIFVKYSASSCSTVCNTCACYHAIDNAETSGITNFQQRLPLSRL